MVITVGGMIGAGKTSLAELLAEHLGSKVFKESVEDNPFLDKFYSATEKEKEKYRYPFLLQLFFLNTRFKSIKEALVDKNNVLDRSIYEDWYFAKVNKDLGSISETEFSLYENLLNNMMEELKELPKKSPDLMIYLHGSFETILERITGRGREYELAPELVDYYKLLWSGYDDWVHNCYTASEILEIDIDKFDYVNNPEDAKEVLKLIDEKLKDVKLTPVAKAIKTFKEICEEHPDCDSCPVQDLCCTSFSSSDFDVEHIREEEL